MTWDQKFYFDKRLAIGGRFSPFEFDKLPTTVEWICQYKCLMEYIFHLLDDFLTIEPPGDTPTALGILKLVFHQLGIPLVPHKCVGPTYCLEFQGITLDTLQMEACLSPTKIQKLMNLVTSFRRRKKCTKRELLRLIGSFSFAARVVVPGQTFLLHMTRLSCTVKRLDHFIYLKGFRDDLDLREKNFCRVGMGSPSFWKTSLRQPQTLKSTQMLQGQSVMGVISRATGLMGYGLRSSSWTPNAVFLGFPDPLKDSICKPCSALKGD